MRVAKMKNSVFKNADWICPCSVAELPTVDVLSKQKKDEKIDLQQDLFNKHFLFRRHFHFDGSNSSVSLRITADDYYKLKINGNIIGQGPAQGYYFDYYWNEYDIGKYLRIGDNEIIVEVYYHGLPCRAYNSGDNRIGLAAEIYKESECILFTDDRWECADYQAYRDSSVIGADVYFPEIFDSRVGVKWSNCCSIETDYVFSKNPVPTVSRYSKKPLTEKLLSLIHI